MRKIIFPALRSFPTTVALLLVTLVAFGSNAYGEQYDGPTQVITVYFAGTLLKSDTVFHYGGGTTQGNYSIPELLQFLYHDQDDSDPNQHKIWVDGIGNMAKGVLDAGLAARHANNCKIHSYPTDPWDPLEKTIKFRSGWGVHLAGFECWDYRLHEALDTNRVTDLFRIMDAHRKSPIILNIIGHSRGGILAMMLAHKVSRLQRRYDSAGPLMPEYEKFKKINIINFDAVPGNINEIGLIDNRSHKFVKSHEYFDLSPRVSNYVGFYAKDERQNIFEAVIPHHSPQTKIWHLALNGAHQTLVGNPRKDGHKYDALTSRDYANPSKETYARPSPEYRMSGYHSAFDTSASDVGIVTSIITREFLSTADWGRVKFNTSWRSSHPGLYYGSANCKGNEQDCARYFMGKYTSQGNMPLDTRLVMRSVTTPEYSALIPEGGLQAWDFEKNRCSIRITNHHQFSTLSKGNGKCTFKARAGGDLVHVSLIDRSPNLSGSGITDQTAEEVCRKLVELTGLPWNCTQ
jgi:hypothetical protein